MRKALHVAAWGLGAILGLAILLILAVVVVGNTTAGRKLVEHEVSKLTSGEVQIVGLAGNFPSALTVSRLQLSDTRGVWMTAERVSLRWSPIALVGAVVHIEQLDVAQADVSRKPVSTPTASSRNGKGSHYPAMDIDDLAIDALVLEPAAAGTRAVLTVRASAHYRSTQNASAHLIARRIRGSGNYELALRMAPTGVNARLQVQEPAGGPIEQLVSLPGLGALAVHANIEGPLRAEHLQLAAHVGDLSANANGTINLPARSADVTYAVNSPPMAPQPGLSWKRVVLLGSVRGPLETPQASARLDVEGLALPDGAQLGSLRADAAADGHWLTIHAVAAALMLPPSEPPLPQGSPVTVQAALRLDAANRPLQLSITNNLLEFKAHALTRGPRSASFELQLPDLAPLAALHHEDLRGTLALSGTIGQSGELTRADMSGTGSVAGTSSAAQLLGAHTRVRLAVTLNGSTLNVQRLELNGRALSVTAAGSAERASAGSSAVAIRSLHAQWRVDLPNLALISPTLVGSLETSGTAEGSPQSLTANVQAHSTLAVHGGPAGLFDVSLQARSLPSAPSGTVHASGRFDGAPLRVDVSVQHLPNALYHVVVTRAAWKSVSAGGDLTAGLDLAAGHGQLQLRIRHLADLQPLVGTALQGNLAATVNLTSTGHHPHAQFELTAQNVRVHGVSADARLSAAGPMNAIRIALHAASPSLGGSPASITANALLNDTARALQLDRFDLRYHGQMVRLLSRPRVMFARGLAVRNLRLGAGRAVMAVDGELSPALQLRASIRQLDAALVNAFEPHLLAQGTFNADARVHGSRSAPLGSASLRIVDLKLASAAAQGLPAINASGSARLEGSTADVATQFDAGSASSLRLSGRLPLNATGAFAMQVGGRLDLALMNPILEEQGAHAAGTLTVSATVRGTARAPQITGTVRLAKGDLRDYTEGIHLGDINARLVGAQGTLRIARMTARAGPGQLSLAGSVGILAPGMPVDVSLSGHHIQPITNDIMTANLDANVHAGGTLHQRLDVTGWVRVNHAAINIPNGFPPEVAVLDVIVPGHTGPSRALTRPLSVGLALSLDAPESIFVQGRGLNAQLGGKLQIAGTSDSPQVGGAFNMIRGSYSLAGTHINFTSGRVSFNGEGLKGKIDPTLDFLAQASVTYNSAPTVVNLHVTGFADSPKVTLSSTPPLPQDDLLALLLFGQPASQLTALQLAETGAALASLSGIGGSGSGGGRSLNPLTWLKNALGLNSLSVGGATPPAGAAAGGGSTISGASVTAGKYVSNKVYVAATQSTTGTSQVQVDVDLSPSLKLQTRLGNGTATAQGTTPQNDPGSSIGITWQHRY
jgi:translocation and assembly module TamB